MISNLNIRRFDVETPLGVVHLVAFPKGAGLPNHREIIFEILSEYTGRDIAAENLTRVRALLDDSSKIGERPTFDSLDFDVNWTHSGQECVVAFGDRGSKCGNSGLYIGVDLEIHNSKRLRVADRFFSPEEKDWIRRAEPLDQGPNFFCLWCRKEALYKCVGGSFFEETLRRSVLKKSLTAGGFQVYFVDLPWDGPASLCIAVTRA